ncbi:HdeD family acid-resistance protein [Sphingomonas ginsenosidimutans]|jgi:uncharacterized membrane protein HdeD (DUF308 family)|uniref:HdeD family acid-resistance protein n=1 Tax=Sphingomonas ginsenosidimutans TaxID=862134 RepID=A0A2A4HWF4_9SPHN|nr:HdeD family acid-resistance protein [Sphingomonas ginsenosidimutans]PCG08015.1 hypothetical protein COA17_14800 [Sphingomonas ginsenosidimutans]
MTDLRDPILPPDTPPSSGPTSGPTSGPPTSPATGAGWGWIMAYGVVSVVLGIAAFAFPYAATFAATVTIGVLFFVSGVFAIAAGLFAQGAESRGYSVLFGILSVVVGALMVMEPVTGAISLTLTVAVWLGARGALELWWGLKMRRRRAMVMALGAVNLLLAVFIAMTVPWSALTLPGYVLAISFLFGGVAALAAAGDHRKGASAFAVPE